MEISNSICDVPGIRVGHAQNETARTGCTVIIPKNGAVAGVDVRGSAPGTREVAAIEPTRHVKTIHAVLLTGGSAFGLAAADGVMRYLEENAVGYDTGAARVPIVPAAVIYDLAIGRADIRPDAAMGYQACVNARENANEWGSIGAGTGATVGKIAGPEYAMPGGIGQASLQLENGIVIGVLVVVNSLGDVISPKTGEIIAGALSTDRKSFLNSAEYLKKAGGSPFNRTNTTLGVVATNAQLNVEEATKLAQMAHDGLARAINPVHTPYDGDTIFALSTGNEPGNLLQLGSAAANLVSEAILRAVQATAPTYLDRQNGFPKKPS